MPETIWTPNEEDILSGQEGYIHYLGGVAIIVAPRSRFSRSFYEGELDKDNIEDTLIGAEQLMLEGLKWVIAFANPPELRTALVSRAQYNFKQAQPNMRRIVASTYKERADRIDHISPAMYGLQPAPVVNSEVIYKLVSRGNLGELHSIRLLDDIPPARDFKKLLELRSMSGRGRVKRHQF